MKKIINTCLIIFDAALKVLNDKNERIFSSSMRLSEGYIHFKYVIIGQFLELHTNFVPVDTS